MVRFALSGLEALNVPIQGLNCCRPLLIGFLLLDPFVWCAPGGSKSVNRWLGCIYPLIVGGVVQILEGAVIDDPLLKSPNPAV